MVRFDKVWLTGKWTHCGSIPESLAAVLLQPLGMFKSMITGSAAGLSRVNGDGTSSA